MAGALLPQGPVQGRQPQGADDLCRTRGRREETQFRRRRRHRLARQGRSGGDPALELHLQLRWRLPRQGRRGLRQRPGGRGDPLLRQAARQLRAEGRDLDVVGKHHAALPGRQGRDVDRCLGVLRSDRRSGEDPGAGRKRRYRQPPGRTEDQCPVHRVLVGHVDGQAVEEQGERRQVPRLGHEQGTRRASHVEQHHDGALLGLGRQGRAREDQPRLG